MDRLSKRPLNTRDLTVTFGEMQQEIAKFESDRSHRVTTGILERLMVTRVFVNMEIDGVERREYLAGIRILINDVEKRLQICRKMCLKVHIHILDLENWCPGNQEVWSQLDELKPRLCSLESVVNILTDMNVFLRKIGKTSAKFVDGRILRKKRSFLNALVSEFELN